MENNQLMFKSPNKLHLRGHFKWEEEVQNTHTHTHSSRCDHTHVSARWHKVPGGPSMPGPASLPSHSEGKLLLLKV